MKTNLKKLLLPALGLFLSDGGCALVSALETRPNVLLICVDDLRPELGCYGCPDIISPNIDRLAAEGRQFSRHYVQSAVCVTSRRAMLTGYRRPARSIWRKPVRPPKATPGAAGPVSFAQVFRDAGYRTVGIGKISHQPGGVLDPEQTKHEVPDSWDLSYAPVGKWKNPWGAFFAYADGSVRLYGYGENRADTVAFEMADVSDEGYPDGLNAQEAIRQLRDLKQREKPFLLAVGFYKPHLPHNAPKKYWDLYDPEEIELASHRRPPANVDPEISLHPSFELTTHYAWPGGSGNITEAQARNQRHAYFACVSYVDAQIGKVLGELKRLGLEEDTVVALWSDHGWHLGDHGIFGKQTNFEVATRSPLIIRVPGMTQPGRAAEGIVETVDLYPTLCDLGGLEWPDDLPGVSMRPMIEDPDHPGKGAAHSYFPRGDLMGNALRTEDYRIVEWADSVTGEVSQVELYDHQVDGDETRNVAADRPEIVEGLLKRLHKYLEESL